MIFGPPRIEEGDDLIACPHCGSSLPARKTPRYSPVRRGKQILSIETGAEYLCPHCGKLYDVGPQGVFVVKHRTPFIPPQEQPQREPIKPPVDRRPLMPREMP